MNLPCPTHHANVGEVAKAIGSLSHPRGVGVGVYGGDNFIELPGSGDRYQECSAGKHRAQHSIRTGLVRISRLMMTRTV